MADIQKEFVPNTASLARSPRQRPSHMASPVQTLRRTRTAHPRFTLPKVITSWSAGLPAALAVSVYNPSKSSRRANVHSKDPTRLRCLGHVTKQIVSTTTSAIASPIESLSLTSLLSQVERCTRDPAIFVAACAVCSLSSLYLMQTFHLRHRHQSKFVAVGFFVGLAASLVPKDQRWLTGQSAISYIPLSIMVVLMLSILLHESISFWRTEEGGHSNIEDNEK
jgi:hypothetical protein